MATKKARPNSKHANSTLRKEPAQSARGAGQTGATGASVKSKSATQPGPCTRYALLVRGINVGTKNSLPMAELRAMLSRAGATEVSTYLQSGNAILSLTESTELFLPRIEKLLSKYMGRPIDTTLRTHAELHEVVSSAPLVRWATNPAYHSVTFLSETPTKTALAPLYAQDFGEERFAVAGRHIYAWHPQGQARSPLAQVLGRLKLAGTITTRNFRTVQTLCDLTK